MSSIEWTQMQSVAKTKDGHPPFTTWFARVDGGTLYATVLREHEPKFKGTDKLDYIGGVRGSVSIVFVPGPAK